MRAWTTCRSIAPLNSPGHGCPSIFMDGHAWCMAGAGLTCFALHPQHAQPPYVVTCPSPACVDSPLPPPSALCTLVPTRGRVHFTPTVAHCSMATLIGLCLRVKLLRCLPPRMKIDVQVSEAHTAHVAHMLSPPPLSPRPCRTPCSDSDGPGPAPSHGVMACWRAPRHACLYASRHVSRPCMLSADALLPARPPARCRPRM